MKRYEGHQAIQFSEQSFLPDSPDQRSAARITEQNIHKTGILCSCRLKKGKELRKAEDLKEVEQNMHIIRAPAGMIAGIAFVLLQKCIAWYSFYWTLGYLAYYL